VSNLSTYFLSSSDTDRTPLHLAVQNNNAYECVRRLLDNGADVLQQDEIGKSPLHIFYNEMSMKIMLRCREDIDPWMQDKGGMTVLHWVAWSRRSTLNLLPQSHQNINGLSCLEIKDGEGKSMLHYAVQRGNLDLITFFLASPYAMAMSMADFSGLSLLHYATESSQVDIIDLLLDANCELDAADAKGRTVLHHAAARDNILAVRRLIQLGASHQLACEDCDGRTPLELARYREAKSVAEYLQSLGQEHNGGETPKLESTNVEGIAPSLYLHQVQMAIAFLVLIILFQSLLLWL
jgi:ankyrin repeat protein